MSLSLGKKFEEVFKKDIQKLGLFIYRLPDQVSGYAYTSKNPCDFIVYSSPRLYLIECKSVHGNTLPFSNITQYETLKSYKDLEGAYPAVVVWFIDHDIVCYVPIQTIVQMKDLQLKSINVNKLEDFNIRIVPSVKKRVFMQSDYSFLKEGGI